MVRYNRTELPLLFAHDFFLTMQVRHVKGNNRVVLAICYSWLSCVKVTVCTFKTVWKGYRNDSLEDKKGLKMHVSTVSS